MVLGNKAALFAPAYTYIFFLMKMSDIGGFQRDVQLNFL